MASLSHAARKRVRSLQEAAGCSWTQALRHWEALQAVPPPPPLEGAPLTVTPLGAATLAFPLPGGTPLSYPTEAQRDSLLALLRDSGGEQLPRSWSTARELSKELEDRARLRVLLQASLRPALRLLPPSEAELLTDRKQAFKHLQALGLTVLVAAPESEWEEHRGLLRELSRESGASHPEASHPHGSPRAGGWLREGFKSLLHQAPPPSHALDLLKASKKTSGRRVLALPLGRASKEPVYWEPGAPTLGEGSPHLLVTGNTGSGKSWVASSLLLAASVSEQWEGCVVLVPDGCGLNPRWEESLTPRLEVVRGTLSCFRKLQELAREVGEREEVTLGSGEPTKPLLVVVEDSFLLLEPGNPEECSALSEERAAALEAYALLVERGAAAGVLLVVVTQWAAGAGARLLLQEDCLRLLMGVHSEAGEALLGVPRGSTLESGSTGLGLLAGPGGGVTHLRAASPLSLLEALKRGERL